MHWRAREKTGHGLRNAASGKMLRSSTLVRYAYIESKPKMVMMEQVFVNPAPLMVCPIVRCSATLDRFCRHDTIRLALEADNVVYADTNSGDLEPLDVFDLEACVHDGKHSFSDVDMLTQINEDCGI